jgi:hypothetical protein
MHKLKFGKGNAKLSKDIYTFSLPAGHACPFAYECKATVNRNTGKLTDGENQTYRCFAASQESLYKNVREARWHNYDILKNLRTAKEMVKMIEDSLPTKAKKVRIHVSGDFFNQTYFDAWLEVSRKHPDITFYAYTKSLPYWEKRMNDIPNNFKLTGSIGGKKDELISKNSLKFAKVVLSKKEAKDVNLEIDHDDSHAYEGKKNFALLLHGVQAKGSKASIALKELKKKGVTGYSRKK